MSQLGNMLTQAVRRASRLSLSFGALDQIEASGESGKREDVGSGGVEMLTLVGQCSASTHRKESVELSLHSIYRLFRVAVGVSGAPLVP